MREDSGVAPGLFSLPSGGGGVGSLGDRFEPDLVRGSGSYALQIHCPKGPNELSAALSLTYSTGSGNGPFGLGWRLNNVRIERATDRGIPGYTDLDTFVIGDAEQLVPVGGNRYRPKTDSKFWLIERTGESWRIRTGDGHTLLFGQNAESCESDSGRTFAWYLDEERDPAGNTITYGYIRDSGRLYLQEIRYSIFHLKVAYERRPDVLRNGRAGFPRQTALRATRIELHCERLSPTLMRSYGFNYTAAINGTSLLSKITLSAQANGETASFPELSFEYSGIDFLSWQVHELQALIPPPNLDDSNTQIVDMTGDGLPDVLQSSGSRLLLWRNRGDGHLEGPTTIDGVPSTVSLDRPNVALADLDGNGRVDLFAVDQPLAAAFVADGRGGFQPQPVIFRDAPTLRLAESNTRLMDIDGDGVTDLITTGRNNFLLFRHEAGIGWQSPLAVQRVADLEHFPDITFEDRGVQLADMSGDGLQDFVSVQSGDVSWWPYYGNGKWGDRIEMTNSPRFPDGYRQDHVHVIDIDGDGCADIVYLDYDRTLIWINQSGSSFSAPVELPIAPGFITGRVLGLDFFGDGRPGLAWSSTANEENSAGYRFLRFDVGKAPYLLTAVNNGLGGRTEMQYSNTTRMRLADQAEGHTWPGQLPFIVQVVEKITDRDEITGRKVEQSFRYHDGIYDGPRREFRGFSSVIADLNGDDSIPASRQEFEFFQGDPENPDFPERERERALAGSLVATRLYENGIHGLVLRQESGQVWDARLEHDHPSNPIFFPFLTSIETREHSRNPAIPVRIERSLHSNYDEHGNVGRRQRESLVQGEPTEKWIRSEERYTYTRNTLNWLVKLPVRTELRDAAKAPFAVRVIYYDGPAFLGMAEGEAEKGLSARTQELRLLDSKLPADYVGDRDLTTLGYQLQGTDDTRGYYSTTSSLRRDNKGNLVEQRDPLGASLNYQYDSDGLYPVKITDALGKETSVVFDPRSGEPASIAYNDGRIMRYEHDAVGRLRASFETDDAGNEHLVKYFLLDLDSRPISVTSLAPQIEGRKPSEFPPGTNCGLLDGVVVSRIYYDGFGKPALQVSSAPDGPGGVRRFLTAQRNMLNPRLMVSTQFLPEFVPDLSFRPFPEPGPGSVRMRYDAEASKEETAGPGPVHHRVVRDNFTVTHFEGSAAGAFGSSTPPGPASRIERFDACSRLYRIEEAKGDGSFISTSYDLTLNGHIQVVRDNSGAEMTRYTFAGPDNIIRITNRDAGTRSYYRDAAGRMVERVNADGSKVFYSFDVLGRMTGIEKAASAGPRETLREIIYDTDPDLPSQGRFLQGRIAVVKESTHTIRYSYNRAGKIVREEVTTGDVTLATAREFNLQGKLQAITYPDGQRVLYTLDRSGKPTDIPGVLSKITYDPDGAVTGYLLVNGVEISTPRETVSRRFAGASACKDGATIRSLSYGYDSVGNVITIRDEMPGDIQFQSFGYDGLYRLAGFTVRQNDSAGTILSQGDYGYDPEGNLLFLEEVRPLTITYTDGAHPGRLTTVASTTDTQNPSYDGRGHLNTFGDLAKLEFDALDRLVHVIKSNGTELAMAYDPQNRLILKQITQGGETTKIRYAAGLFERYETHFVRHIHLANGLVASETIMPGPPISSTIVYYLTDHHGTVVLATDDAGKAIQNQRYSPFGSSLMVTQLDRYLGREKDAETGLLQLGARYYAPALGRFISPDWFVLENPSKPARMPQGFNLYGYCLNNPLAFKDPGGMWFWAAAAFVVGFIAGTISGLIKGQGWGSLLTGLETGITTAIGYALGIEAGFALRSLPLFGAEFGGAMGGLNGLFSGMHHSYDWEHPGGWLAFLSDSTWGLLGTSLGNFVQIINNIAGIPYCENLTKHKNRTVYAGGLAVKADDAFTMGNVTSNASLNGKGINMNLLDNHEAIHILQNRIFGPLYQTVYAAWLVGGFIAGTMVWVQNMDHDYGSIIETVSYFDNPWEYWAYNTQHFWQPKGQSGFDPIAAWS